MTQVPTPPPPAVEVVMYRIAPPIAEAQHLVLHDVNRLLQTHAPGFRNRTVWQSLDDPQWLLDWVEWADLSSAVAAAQAMPQRPEFAPFLGSIAELKGMWHARLLEGQPVFNDRPAVLEVVVYELRQASDAPVFQAAYGQVLAEMPGYLGRHILQDSQQSNRFIEHVRWASEPAARAVEARMAQHPVIQQVFPLVARVELMALFRPLP